MTVLLVLAGAGILLSWLLFNLWRHSARDAAAARSELAKVQAEKAIEAKAISDYAESRDRIEEGSRETEDAIRATPPVDLLDRANALFPGLRQRSGDDTGTH